VSFKSLEKVAGRIRRLEIQGATNVAIVALKAVEDHFKESKVKTRNGFLGELESVRAILFDTRPTEPLMRNAIRYLIYAVKDSKLKDPKDLAGLVSELSKRFLDDLAESKRLIGEIGSRRVLDGSTVLVHCHSSMVTQILAEAKKAGKDFQVFCTETRPLYQGRITARELVGLGIESIMVVDSATRFFMNEVDLVLVGADAITSEGNVINKIGTSMVSQVAREARTPFYVASMLLKFDPETVYGEYTVIEERDGREIWAEPPEGLQIRNPAFDVTRREFIHGIVCEVGVLSPEAVMQEVDERYPWVSRLGLQ
jgi:ribose 1,5-bisphosphate isomerase